MSHLTSDTLNTEVACREQGICRSQGMNGHEMYRDSRHEGQHISFAGTISVQRLQVFLVHALQAEHIPSTQSTLTSAALSDLATNSVL